MSLTFVPGLDTGVKKLRVLQRVRSGCSARSYTAGALEGT